jgi:Fur family peroxide stress response transcriptional regulator
MPTLSRTVPAVVSEARVADLLAALRGAGLRITPQRVAVCRALAGTKSHPTAQALYEQLSTQFESLSRATVYNTLETLVQGGLIHELGDAGDGAVHYDADVAPHVNLICLRCHRIDDLPVTALDRVERQVAEHSGYEVRGARLVYYGLCPDCRKQAPRTRGK